MPRPNSRFTVTRDFDAAPVAGPAMSQDVWDGIEPAGPEPSSHLAEVLNLMHSARPLLDVSDLEMEVLSHARRETTAQLIVQRDNGDHTIFVGHRVQWNDARGPFKGGIRFHPSETLDMTRALAALMMLKTAVLDLPLGGGKGGVQCNPAALSRPERERLSRSYIRAMHPVLGPALDIPAPDMNTDAEIMGWMPRASSPANRLPWAAAAAGRKQRHWEDLLPWTGLQTTSASPLPAVRSSFTGTAT